MATVVDKTQSTKPADADKKVFDPEHASGVVTLNGEIVVSPDERAPVGAQVRSVGLVEYEVEESPAPLPEGGVVDTTAAPQTTEKAGKKP
jgi:hypothetical protein